MDKIISYTDVITNYISGSQYSGKNIKTKDGKLAYITKTGIAKPYKSINSLSNVNGCTTELQQIGSAWGDMGIPIGSLMVDGQSCGNETKYVQSMPPSTNFDWEYYIKSNPNLQLTTEQQAYDHWTSTGIYQGLLPNPTILSNMSNVGKIGYIDVNTTLHPVPKTDYKYAGDYKLFNTINVTGSAMEDCTVPPPNIQYGDQLFIKYGEQYASMNQQSVLEFGINKTNLFIRPPIGEETLDKTPLSYGSKITIAASSSNVYTPDCGWWGCKVAYLNSETSTLSFGPGGENSQTFIITVPPGTNYENNAQLKYGDPFSIMAITHITWKKQERLDYGGNGIQSGSTKSLADCQSSCIDTEGCVGIITDNSGSNKCWMKNKFSGASVNNDTNAYMLPSAAENVNFTPSATWEEIGNRDYSGNDISSTIKSLDDCKSSCLNTTGCVAIVTDGSGKNNCWLKRDLGKGNQNKNRNTYQISSIFNPPAFKTVISDESLIGYVNNNNLMFGSSKLSVGKNQFVFESATSPPYVMECDLSKLQNSCNDKEDCTGFIHSTKDNTWQMTMEDSSAGNYKIIDTPPNIYVKNLSVKNTNANFIDSDMFANYPYDNNFSDGNVKINNSELEKKQNEYKRGNLMASQQAQTMQKTYPQIPPYIQETKHMYTQLNTKTNEYKDVLKTIKKEKKKYRGTYEQQKDDLDLLQESNKINALLWGLASIVVISMVVMIKNKN